MKSDFKFILFAVFSSVAIVSAYNYLSYKGSLDKDAVEVQETCSFIKEKTRRGIRGVTTKTFWKMKTLKNPGVYSLEGSALLGLKIEEDALRQGVDCLSLKDPKSLYLKITHIQGQKVEFPWVKNMVK